MERCRRPEVRTNCQRRTLGPPRVVRHSGDFGVPVAVMTRVISRQELLAQICSKTIASPTREATVASCHLPQLINASQE